MFFVGAVRLDNSTHLKASIMLSWSVLICHCMKSGKLNRIIYSTIKYFTRTRLVHTFRPSVNNCGTLSVFYYIPSIFIYICVAWYPPRILLKSHHFYLQLCRPALLPYTQQEILRVVHAKATALWMTHSRHNCIQNSYQITTKCRGIETSEII